MGLHPQAARLAPFNAILFDAGSTLVYFDGKWPEVIQRGEAALLQSLQSAGLSLDGNAFLRMFREQREQYYAERETEFIEYTTAYILRTLLAELGYPNPPEEVIRQALAAMYAISQPYWKAEEDAIPTLRVLLERGYRLGMISNAGDDADVQTLVSRNGLRPFFDVILTSAAVGIRKPNPRIFQLVLDRWGMRPSQAVMVGDTLGADILGAKNAGLFSIWITRHADTPGNRAHLDTIQPDAVISVLSELPDLLTKLQTG